jgi:hypothetical protein
MKIHIAGMGQMTEPTDEDKAWFDRESGFVGFHKPATRVFVEVQDKYAWKRQEAANRLGIKEEVLADEPDEIRLDQQGLE